MSDLQDLIATNAVRAYNEGFERGVASEQERIVAMLLDGWARNDNAPIIQAIKGEQK